jgi:hypothetical protein
MLLFQWNALRVGDLVDVHDDKSVGFDIHRGAVSIVQTRGYEANDVAVVAGGTGSVLRPRRNAVHLVPSGDAPTCWRCAVAAGSVADLDALVAS